MASNKVLTAAALSLAGLAGAAGFTLVAHAEPTASSTPSASASAQPGQQDEGTPGVRGDRQGRPAPHAHTAVTGDELTKVSDAVKAKYTGAEITSVEKDPDGSYDVRATKDGQSVMFETSADLATITEGKGPDGQGKGGHGKGGHGGRDTPVTGDEAQKVIDAVQAKESGTTITEVQKDPDNSYDAMGTKDGKRVAFDVSSDLGTITARAER